MQLETWSKPEPLLADQDPGAGVAGRAGKSRILRRRWHWKRCSIDGNASPQLLPVRFACAKTAEPAHKAAVEAHKQALEGPEEQATKEYEKKKAEIEGKRLERQVELFQRKITLGRWAGDRRPVHRDR
ncbi:MAG: hypothetical protein R3E96_02630 [Planctomycetota bacterium]